MTRYTTRLLAGGLTVLLSACAYHPYKTVPGTTVLVARVPESMTEPVAVPEPKGRTNGDLAEWADGLARALRVANEKLRRIREL